LVEVKHLLHLSRATSACLFDEDLIDLFVLDSITHHATLCTLLVLCVPAASAPTSSSPALVIVNPSEHFLPWFGQADIAVGLLYKHLIAYSYSHTCHILDLATASSCASCSLGRRIYPLCRAQIRKSLVQVLVPGPCSEQQYPVLHGRRGHGGVMPGQ